jgi:hypothetical protein
MSSLLDRDTFKKYQKTPKEGCYDFYRCFFCGRIFSRANEEKAMMSDGRICACGSVKYKPAWPVWIEWIYPRIVSYTFKLILAREVAPWLDRNGFHGALRKLERLV